MYRSAVASLADHPVPFSIYLRLLVGTAYQINIRTWILEQLYFFVVGNQLDYEPQLYMRKTVV